MPVKARSKAVTLNLAWQLGFLAAAGLLYITSIAPMLLMVANHGYLNAGTWTFQISQWLLPVVFLGAAFILLRGYGFWLNRVFMATLAALMGLIVYGAAEILTNLIWYNFFPPNPDPHDKSLWTAFGTEWTVMGVTFLLYVAVLLFVRRKSAR